MPLGRFSDSSDGVLGLSSGSFRGDELENLTRLQATHAIQRWEETNSSASATPQARKAAMWDVVRALFPMGRKSFDLNGKRYKVISNAKTTNIRVTPAPEKKKRS